jgi:guanine nucleotide-binding protein G(i) subunit alpha
MVTESYEPTEDDVLRIQSRSVHDFLSTKKQHNDKEVYRFTNIDSQHHIPKNIVSSFDSVTTIIFCANLADYDQGLEANKLVQSMNYFDSIINRPCFRRYTTSVVLLLTHADEFREKLVNSPLAKHFPGFRGGCNIKQAEQYVIQRFRQVNRACLTIIHQTTQLVTTELIFDLIDGSCHARYLEDLLCGVSIS